MQNLNFSGPRVSFPKFSPAGQSPKKPVKKEAVPQPYQQLVRIIGQLLSMIKLYGVNHKMFKDKINEVFPQVTKLLSSQKPISFFESEGVLIINRREIKANDLLIKRLANSLRDLDAGYITLEQGLTLDEFTNFMRLLNNEGNLKGEGKVKKYLNEKGIKHILVRSAIYKLIEEDEKVVKKEEVLEVEELSYEIRQRFLQDLKNQEVSRKLKKEEQKYKELAHDPQFLAKAIFDLAKDKDNPEDLAKVIWLIGDYMIGEIDSAKEEKINRMAIEKLKKQIFILWGENPTKPEIERHVQKTFSTIFLALELKGLLTLYEKHQKNLKKTASKIQNILDAIPRESQLFQKIKDKLSKLGLLTAAEKPDQ